MIRLPFLVFLLLLALLLLPVAAEAKCGARSSGRSGLIARIFQRHHNRAGVSSRTVVRSSASFSGCPGGMCPR